MILILGHLGNMGRRYSLILDSLNVEWMGLDAKLGPLADDTIREAALNCKGVIIATPTQFHEHHLMLLHDLQKPVLCEKPLSKNLKLLKDILLCYQQSYTPLSMVLQYKELLNDVSDGHSSYNYFKTGNDGLLWDCIQIVGLAKGEVEIKNDSPVWKCEINGQKLSLSDMDQAYIWCVKRWLNGDYQNLKEIYEIHRKTTEYINENRHRNTGPEYVN